MSWAAIFWVFISCWAIKPTRGRRVKIQAHIHKRTSCTHSRHSVQPRLQKFPQKQKKKKTRLQKLNRNKMSVAHCSVFILVSTLRTKARDWAIGECIHLLCWAAAACCAGVILSDQKYVLGCYILGHQANPRQQGKIQVHVQKRASCTHSTEC